MSRFHKEKKRELFLFSYYDFAGIARHLENRARQGWQLEQIGGSFWRYHRAEPAEIRYAVVYFAKASDLDAEPSREQRDFWAMCQSAGWQLAASRGQMQVFCHPDPAAIPIETDPVVQVENVHTSMKKSLLPSYLLLTVCALFEVLLQSFTTDTIRDFLLSPFPLGNLLLWGALGLFCGQELLRYLLWLRTARTAAREEGLLLSAKSCSFLPLALLTVCGLYMLLFLFTAVERCASPTLGFALLFGVIYATALILSIRGSQHWMKQRGISSKVNRIVSAAIGIVVGMALIAAVTKLTINSGGWFRMRSHIGAETIAYSVSDGNRTHTYDFYRDTLPLRAEDLTRRDADPDYSCYLEQEGTPFLREYTVRQDIPPFWESDSPDLTYTVWEVGLGVFYEPVKNSFFSELAERNEKYSFPGEKPDTWTPVEAAPWGALEAYQYYAGDDPWNTYLLCYENRFVKIQFDLWTAETPTDTQMALVEETLGRGPL